MGTTEFWTGTLKRIDIPENLDTWKEEVIFLQNQGFHFDDLDIEGEWFSASHSDCLYIVGGWYKVEKKRFNPEEIKKITQVGPMEYSFMVSFYNGGGCLQERMEEMVSNCSGDKIEKDHLLEYLVNRSGKTREELEKEFREAR